MAPSPDEFLTVADVAWILKLNQQSVRNWIDQVKLPHSESAVASESSGPISIVCWPAQCPFLDTCCGGIATTDRSGRPGRSSTCHGYQSLTWGRDEWSTMLMAKF